MSFIVSIILETIVDMELIPDNQTVKIIQYVVLLGPVALSFLRMGIDRKGFANKLFWTELKAGLIVVGVFLTFSLHKSIMAGHFSFESVMQLFQIIVPFLFTYVLINELSESDIEKFMKVALWMTFIGYVVAVSANFSSFINILSISIFNSYSPFENSTFAEIASGLGAYFIYYRKKMPGYTIFVVILNLLIFKRVLMLMTLMLLIISLANKQKEEVSEKLMGAAYIGWPILIISFYKLYQPETVQMIIKKFGFDFVTFSTYRIYRLWYVLETNFVSYGLGSTTEYINSRNLSYLGSEFEMDFVRLLFELGIIAIIIFVWAYLYITKRNKYAFWLMNFCFLNLLMANGLLKYWGWTMRLITIALINYGTESLNQSKQENNRISKQIKMKKIRVRL